jgi:CheY-like chemotaxis protein
MERALFTILLLEDDPNDVLLIRRALRKNNILNPVHCAADGVEGIDYLAGKGEYADRSRFPVPRCIFMDLKMPRMGGIEVLQWIHDHPEFQVVPTIVLSSSKLPVDIVRAYRLGANSYLVKPASFEELQRLMGTSFEYWSLCSKPEPGELLAETARQYSGTAG